MLVVLIIFQNIFSMEHSTEEGTNLNEFCPHRWLRLLSKVASNPQEVDIDAYTAHLYETTNLFKKMGSALSMAFSGNLSQF